MGSPAASTSPPPWTLSLNDAFSSPETAIWEISYEDKISTNLDEPLAARTGRGIFPYVDFEVSVKQGLEIVV